MNRIILALLFLLGMASTVSAAQTLTSDASVFSLWVPVIILAVVISVGITIVFYAIATLLGNGRLKAAALYEFTQVIGTVVILMIIFGVFNLYSSSVYGSYSHLTASVSSICGPPFQLSASPIDFLNSNTVGPTESVCNLVRSGPSSGLTNNIDYGLGSTYVIVANITDQAGISLNDLNIFENFYNTLDGINPSASICWPGGTCALNPNTYQGKVSYSFFPYNMFGKIRGGTLFIAAEAELSFYMGLLELMAIIVVLFGWPYMLAAGLILRSSFLTRRVGGLVIAIVLVGMILYPFLNLFEYSSLTNTTSPLSAVGANVLSYNSIPVLTLTGEQPEPCLSVQGTGTAGCQIVTYDIGRTDFYVFPRLDYILNYYGCWPIGGNLLLSEAKIVGIYSIPGVAQVYALTQFIGGFTSDIPSFLEASSCTPSMLFESVLAVSNFYGQTFVFMVMLPVLNILMLLSAVKGLSSLLGGDTSLLGIGRLV